MDPVLLERDRRMLLRAMELADQARGLGEVPVGCVIYRVADGQIVAEGFNRKELASDATGHAEMLAIRAAGVKLGDWRLEGLALAVTLEPCCMCAGAIVHARLDRLVYATRDPKAGYCQSLGALTSDPRLNHRVMPLCAEVFDPALAAAASEQLKQFFRLKRQTP